ncbi:alcohol dehydrogenase catalytic domain-containing protein [Halobacteriovorax marinus]|uniref:alcohol dehydrogenase catalytic domain-containing protein n=1 Tax=Halobacteriovorax marinus TaxID=97084 RepID=UPI003A8CCD2E
MKDWFYTHENGSFKKIERESNLVINDEEVLIEPISVGICGSDLFSIKFSCDERVAIGHEWVGKVLSVGANVEGVSVGERVSSAANYCCQECKSCVDRNWSECTKRKLLGTDGVSVISNKIKVHHSDLVKLPEQLSVESQVLLEVAFIGDLAFEHSKRIGLRDSDKVVIFGAGPIGIFAYLAFKFRGYNPVLVEKKIARVKRAKDLGFNVENLAKVLISGDHYLKYDMVIDCTGSGDGGPGILPQAHLFAKRSGGVVVIGKYDDVKIDSNSYHRSNLKASWLGYHSVEEFRESIKFWEPRIGDYSEKLVKKFEFSHVEEAFTEAQDRESFKCVLARK